MQLNFGFRNSAAQEGATSPHWYLACCARGMEHEVEVAGYMIWGEGKPKPFHLLAESKDGWNDLGWLFCILSLHCCIRSSPRAEEMMLSKVLGCHRGGTENHGQ